jgi:GrpB-like predicted nucleotidyltransferase (UPF0157 family)
MTEEQIRVAYVGELVPLVGPIHIVDYAPEWPRFFEHEAERDRAALGDRVLLLEHVGSTSVPGLAAKLRIDVLLVVADSADEPATSRPWRLSAMCCASESRTGMSTACSRGRTLT